MSQTPLPRRKRKLHEKATVAFAFLLIVYLLVAYLIMPFVWLGYVHWHPALDSCPDITLTSDDHPGDPLNVGLIGAELDVKRIMQAAGWFPADALGLRSDLRIAADTVLEKQYVDAPVSSLYLFGRKEDLAYEKPVGHDPRQRHHVRFWKSSKLDDQDRPLWFGSVTYDQRVGLSHTTGQITHHIAADVDTERDRLFDDLIKTGEVKDVRYMEQFHKTCDGSNGGGDPWHTDGRLRIGTLESDDRQR